MKYSPRYVTTDKNIQTHLYYVLMYTSAVTMLSNTGFCASELNKMNSPIISKIICPCMVFYNYLSSNPSVLNVDSNQ